MSMNYHMYGIVWYCMVWNAMVLYVALDGMGWKNRNVVLL